MLTRRCAVYPSEDAETRVFFLPDAEGSIKRSRLEVELFEGEAEQLLKSFDAAGHPRGSHGFF